MPVAEPGRVSFSLKRDLGGWAPGFTEDGPGFTGDGAGFAAA
jgi:hypothetical protein